LPCPVWDERQKEEIAMMDATTSALKETDSPLPAAGHDLEITGITFDEGKLWKPRYGSLFSYVPDDFQFEPAFQVLSSSLDLEIQVLFEIGEDQKVRFQSEDGEPEKVRCRSIEKPSAVLEHVSVTFVDEEKRACLLRWKRSDKDPLVMTYRIYCDKEGADDAFSRVEGGLYLTVIYKPKRAPSLEQIPKRSARESRSVKVIDFDKHGRPVYDLFLPDPDSIPETIELEPAVRAREGDRHGLTLELEIPGLVFETEAPLLLPRRAKVYPYQPDQRPRQLVRAETEVGDKVCNLEWQQGTERRSCRVGSTSPLCYLGATASFFFKTRAENPALKDLAAVLDVDPTVIQPPVCNDGVCIPPPNDPASGARG
jgi:hypothetical protein